MFVVFVLGPLSFPPHIIKHVQWIPCPTPFAQDFINTQRIMSILLQWRHNERDGLSNYKGHDCLVNRLFGRRSKKTSKLRVTGLCVGNSPVTGEFPAQRTSKMFPFGDVIVTQRILHISKCWLLMKCCSIEVHKNFNSTLNNLTLIFTGA